MLDERTKKYILEKLNGRAPQVRAAIRGGRYHDAVMSAVASFGIDGRAREELELEVLYVLLGIQSISEFEHILESHPVLSMEQGRRFAQDIRKTLFAELALYLPGMEEDAARSAVATLRDSIAAGGDVETRLAKLPGSVQTTIRSPELESAFADIQKRHGVTGPVAAMLGMSIARVMVGLTTMNDFKVAVARDAGIPPNNLEALFLDVEQRLFKPVRTTIMSALERTVDTLPTKQTGTDPYHASAK